MQNKSKFHKFAKKWEKNVKSTKSTKNWTQSLDAAIAFVSLFICAGVSTNFHARSQVPCFRNSKVIVQVILQTGPTQVDVCRLSCPERVI